MSKDSPDFGSDLRESRAALHQIFSILFPNQTRIEDGNRLNGLMFINQSEPVEYSQNRERLRDEFGIGTNQGLRDIIGAFEEHGIIIEEDNNINITNKGERIIESLRAFLSEYQNRHEPSDGQSLDSPYYDSVGVKIYTNGEDFADYLWLWELINKDSDPIESVTHTASSGGSIIDDWMLDYSNNVSEHERTVDHGDFVAFDMSFRQPIQPGESKRYWHSYRLDRNLHPEWKPLRFVYNCREYPVVRLSVDIINDKKYSIKPESLKHRVELPNKDSKLGSYQPIDFEFTPTPSFNIINFKAVNVPVDAAIDLIWDFEY